MRDRPDISRSHAIAQLAQLQRGDTLHIILRGPSQRWNMFVDFVVPPTQPIGEAVALVLDRQYIHRWKGVQLRKTEQPQALIEALSLELFGERHQFQTVWL